MVISTIQSENLLLYCMLIRYVNVWRREGTHTLRNLRFTCFRTVRLALLSIFMPIIHNLGNCHHKSRDKPPSVITSVICLSVRIAHHYHDSQKITISSRVGVLVVANPPEQFDMIDRLQHGTDISVQLLTGPPLSHRSSRKHREDPTAARGVSSATGSDVTVVDCRYQHHSGLSVDYSIRPRTPRRYTTRTRLGGRRTDSTSRTVSLRRSEIYCMQFLPAWKNIRV